MFKILIAAILLALSVYLDVCKRKSTFVCLVFYVSFLLALIRVFEALLDWAESAVITVCLLIYVGILLVVRKVKKYEHER